MIKRLIVLFFITLILIGCSDKSEPNQDKVRKDEIEIVASQLQIPWSITKLHDVFYISERGGTIAKIEDGVVGAYQNVEDTVVGTYKKVEDKFVDTFLEDK